MSRPVHLTDAHVRDLVSGKSLELGEHSRPRAVTPKQVELLSKGKDVSLEKLPMLERVAEIAGPVSGARGSAPHTLTHKEVEALRAGKGIGFEKRDG
jgi:hypothetical protein